MNFLQIPWLQANHLLPGAQSDVAQFIANNVNSSPDPGFGTVFCKQSGRCRLRVELWRTPLDRQTIWQLQPLTGVTLHLRTGQLAGPRAFSRAGTPAGYDRSPIGLPRHSVGVRKIHGRGVAPRALRLRAINPCGW